MKFSNMERAKDKYGFEFVKNDVMVGDNKCGCLICGTPTEYIEVCSEAHFCSEECVNQFYNQLNELDKKREEAITSVEDLEAEDMFLMQVQQCFIEDEHNKKLGYRGEAITKENVRCKESDALGNMIENLLKADTKDLDTLIKEIVNEELKKKLERM